MKKTFLSIAMSAILVFSFVFVACNRNSKEIQPENTTSKQNVRGNKNQSLQNNNHPIYQTIGSLHNDALHHLVINFDTNYQIDTVAGYAGLFNVIRDSSYNYFVNRLPYLSNNPQLASNITNEYKFLCHKDSVYARMKNPALRQSIENLPNLMPTQVDSFDKEVLLAILDLAIAGAEERVDDAQVISTISNYKEQWYNRYGSNQTLGGCGTLSGICLHISAASNQFWQDNRYLPFVEPKDVNNPQLMAINGAADLGGAVIGAVGAAAIQYTTTGGINGWGVVGGAVVGAVNGSFGLAPKVGKAILDYARTWLGYFY
jgi:hypothetical protein